MYLWNLLLRPIFWHKIYQVNWFSSSEFMKFWLFGFTYIWISTPVGIVFPVVVIFRWHNTHISRSSLCLRSESDHNALTSPILHLIVLVMMFITRVNDVIICPGRPWSCLVSPHLPSSLDSTQRSGRGLWLVSAHVIDRRIINIHYIIYTTYNKTRYIFVKLFQETQI